MVLRFDEYLGMRVGMNHNGRKRPTERKPDTTLNGRLLGELPPWDPHEDPYAHRMGQTSEILWFWWIDDHCWSTRSAPLRFGMH